MRLIGELGRLDTLGDSTDKRVVQKQVYMHIQNSMGMKDRNGIPSVRTIKKGAGIATISTTIYVGAQAIYLALSSCC
jgi:hypothetical protein